MSKLKIRKKLIKVTKKATYALQEVACLSTTDKYASVSNSYIKKFIPILGFMSATSAVFALTNAIAPRANAANVKAVDTIVIVDESGSMAGEQAWLQQVIPSLESAFKTANYGSGSDTNRYGLVGFGSGLNPGNLGRSLTANGNLFFDASQYSTASSSLRTSGSFEDGYSAIDFVLNNYNFRPGVVTNFILVTDEDRDNGNNSLTSQNTLSNLQSQGILLNAVINARFRDGSNNTALGIDSKGNAYLTDGSGDVVKSTGGVAISGYGTTVNDYVNVALNTGGGAWNLNQLRQGGTVANSFTKGFIDLKVQEVVRTDNNPKPVPEPITILGSAMALGIGGYLKKVYSTKQKANLKA
ncbi:MAG: PEP-CTERM sorting domain-containing protein [Scytonema sp. PMC 1069.18]|nr:PEP-CTERM sorting domain-containing protein [Scytonema sp. PMC 1069.18]MEC4884518.1 PEP-CTERM sorting domain-containing protein [Scytonema sp. PMC 1070.18]